MTSIQMRTALVDIYQGRAFEESQLPDNPKNRAQWEELKSEIENGFPIDIVDS